MINKVTLIGNAGNSPEIRHLENGTSVARVSIATSESRQQQPGGEWITHTEWHNVVMWRELAERADKIYKGAQVYIEGKIAYREYEKDGQKVRVTDIVASSFRVLSKKAENEPTETQQPFTAPTMPATPTAKQPPASNAKQVEVPFDDLPF